MPQKSNVIPSDTLGNIDLNSQGFVDDGSVRASIESARNLKAAIKGIDSDLANTMKEMGKYLKESSEELSGLVNELNKLDPAFVKAFKNSKLFKKATDDLNVLKNAQKDYNQMIEDQNVSKKELVQLYNRVTEAYTESADAISYLTSATWDNNDSVEDLKSNLRVLFEVLKDGTRLTKEDLQNLSKTLNNLGRSSNSFGKRFTKFADTARSTISDIKSMMSLDKLAEGIGPSTQMQVQTQYQRRYNLSRAEFNSFKQDVYSTFDNSLYSRDAVMETLQSVNSMGFRNQRDITRYFNEIIRGQQILGMSAENQTALMQLSNQTGRDELTLGTNTFAKYFKEITNVSKEQLNQLISINTNFASQMANLGVTSDAFRNTNEAVTGALTKASGGVELANLYNQVVGSYANSTDLAAEMVGMSSGQWKTTSSGGVDLISILESGRGRAGQYYKAMQSGNFLYQDELSQGMDSSTKNLIDQIVRYQNEGKLTRSLINKFKGMDGEKIKKELEDITSNNLSDTEKIVNALQNNYDKMIDWKSTDTLDNFLSGISNLLVLILGAIALKGNLFGDKGILSGIKSIGASSKLGVLSSGAGGLKGIAATYGTGAAVGAGLLSAASIGGGLYLGFSDANKMSYGKGLDLGDARGFFLGTGHSEQTTGQKIGSIAGNTAKYALIGAGIGTIIPGVGTAVGAGVGALAGLATGLFGTMASSQKESNKQLEKIEKNTAKSANALSIREVGRTTVSTIPYSSKAEGSKAKGSKAKGSAGSPARAMGGPVGIGGTRGLKFGVSSPYGSRSFDGWHYGVDFSGGNINGAPLYSNVSGTVVDVGKDPDGANFVGVKGSDGYIHYYWHMIAPSNRKVGDKVDQGDLVGYVGSTGNSTGPHLHYQVTRSRYSDGYRAFLSNSVNPESFATNAIFSGTAAYYNPDYDGLDASNSSSSVSTSSLLASINKKTANIKLATFGSPHGSTGIINSIVDLKNTIVGLSNQATANEKLMRAITNTYNTQPRMS